MFVSATLLSWRDSHGICMHHHYVIISISFTYKPNPCLQEGERETEVALVAERLTVAHEESVRRLEESLVAYTRVHDQDHFQVSLALYLFNMTYLQCISLSFSIQSPSFTNH